VNRIQRFSFGIYSPIQIGVNMDSDVIIIDEGIRPFLNALFPAPKKIQAISDRTITFCCDELTTGEIREAVKKGCAGPSQSKAFLRCDMGVCQGHMCGASVIEVMRQAMGKTPSDI
jgi:hypothetical protein